MKRLICGFSERASTFCWSVISLLALLVSSVGLNEKASAGIVISNLSLTTNSVSFDISGTFPDTTPPTHGHNDLYFVNPILKEDPGFVLITRQSTSFSFAGSKAVGSVGTGSSSYGDYFWLQTVGNFAPGESFSGILTADWDADVFDPSEVTSLDVYWGANDDPANSGVYLTSVSSIPEPSSAILLGLAVSTCVASRLRRANPRAKE